MKLVASEPHPFQMKQMLSAGAVKQVKLVAAELRILPLKMKQMASAEALKQVKLVASELRPPKMKQVASEASRFQAEARLNHPRLAIKSLGFRV